MRKGRQERNMMAEHTWAGAKSPEVTRAGAKPQEATPFLRKPFVYRKMTQTKKASLTAEAAFAVPLAFYAIMLFLYFFLLLQVQAEVQGILTNITEQAAAYGTVFSTVQNLADRDETEQMLEEYGFDWLAGKLVDETYLSLQMHRYTKDAGWLRLIKQEGLGFHFSGSALYEQEGMLEIVVNYRFCMPAFPFSVGELPVVQRVSARSFYGMCREKKVIDQETTQVYISENGTVYHNTANCSYLKVALRTIPYADIGKYRSKDGEIYYPCESCAKAGNPISVYITSYGNRYHASPSCKKIYHNIQGISLAEAEEKGYRPCSKCGKVLEK